MDNNTQNPEFGENGLKKAAAIYQLSQTPEGSRDEAWASVFLENVPEAFFITSEPQVMKGPDGFPYFVLKSPEPETEFQPCFIRDVVPNYLLQQGFGIVVNPQEDNKADWVFTYGDLLNFFLKDQFYSDSDNWIVKEEDTIRQGEQLMLSAPSEYILPDATRNILRSYFAAQGAENVKVVMVNRPKGEEFLQQLMFNLTPKDFESEEKFGHVMNWLSWFLPKHYSYGSIDEKALGEENFMPL